jgi:hypothetical protein
MKAKCPNDPNHKEFVTVAYVSEDWVVDENGDFIEVFENNDTCILHEPSADNIWYCNTCDNGTEAKVER